MRGTHATSCATTMRVSHRSLLGLLPSVDNVRFEFIETHTTKRTFGSPAKPRPNRPRNSAYKTPYPTLVCPINHISVGVTIIHHVSVCRKEVVFRARERISTHPNTPDTDSVYEHMSDLVI